ncbi:MAG: cytochrome b/b6 domain-containing protein [Fimbriimonas sp.]|nr:cytochrome b/b6 domain-containing protein [Fimbriimonas sp.]
MIQVLKQRKMRRLSQKDQAPIQIENKHPLAIRWFHWINFPVMLVMVWSGILIYWAAAPDKGLYTITLFGHEFFRFFPSGFYAPGANEEKNIPGIYTLSQRLAEGMSWHFLFTWIFTINGVLYVLYTAISGEWRHILPRRSSFSEALHVVLHDLHLRKDPPPRRKFNGAQQFAYTGVVLMGIGSLVTGIAIYKPIQASRFTQLLGGYEVARFFHFWLMMLFVLFFTVHVFQVIRTGWNNFRSMVTGYEIVEGEKR